MHKQAQLYRTHTHVLYHTYTWGILEYRPTISMSHDLRVSSLAEMSHTSLLIIAKLLFSLYIKVLLQLVLLVFFDSKVWLQSLMMLG